MHTPKLIFLFIFLSVLNSTADIKPRIDGWSLVHFFGGVAVCNIMGSDIRAVVVTTWLACVWEIYIDQYNNAFLGFESDKNGPDFLGDALITGLGAYWKFSDA